MTPTNHNRCERESRQGNSPAPRKRALGFLGWAVLLAVALIQSGCVGLTGASSSDGLTFSPAKVDFGEIAAGSKKNVTVTLTNTTANPLTLPQATIAGSAFSFSGLELPVTVEPDGVLTFTATFSPAVTGSNSGTLVVSSEDAESSPASLALSGTGLSATGPTITTQPASQSVTTGQTASFSVNASGSDPLSYQWKKNGSPIGGATASSHTTPATSVPDSGAQFTVTVTDSVGSVTSSAATLTVTVAPVAPSITSQPVNRTVIAGQAASFSVAATGTAPMAYQWRKNGATINGATASSYTTPPATSGDNGAQYSVIVLNSAGGVTSASATLTVNAPVVITGQPAGRSVTAGQTATFSVVATGSFSLSYQWRKNGASINGAIGSSYTTPVTTTADNGAQFSVVVTGAAGSVTSNSATLAVTAPTVAPSITSQPASRTVTAGQTAPFSVTATGTALSYQWRRNGTNVNGATGSSYTTPATTTADNGVQFSVVVTGNAGSVTSNNATLTVTTTSVAPSITSQPVNRTVAAGQTAAFSVTAGGTSPLSYQWRKNGANIGGATGASYTTPATTLADSGAEFSVVVSNSVGTATSNSATLTVNTAPSITGQPASQTVAVAQTATFSVTAGGTAPLSYQWRKGGANINGATSASYTTPAAAASDNGAQFTVVVSNSVGSATSNAATLSVNSAPSITSQPPNRTVVAGQTASFSVTAGGTAPMSYQWRKNGAAINGATSASYTTPATVTADNGAQFTVVVGNAVGSVTSNAGTLTVNAATLLLSTSVTTLNFGNVNVGSSKVMSATISNTGNSSVSIGGVTQSGPGFSAGGVSSGLTLNPGQTATLNVTFAPTSAGAAAGSVAVSSNATNGPVNVTLSGTGVQPVQLTSNLSWNASTSSVTGYYAYRGSISGGPYTRLNSSSLSSTSHSDSTVQPGQRYYYVVTSVNSSGTESLFSNEVSVVVPAP